jgi:hypothetical protein
VTAPAAPEPRPSEVDAFAGGATCAVAAQGQRDLQRLADADPDLFPRNPFDGSVFSTLAMANAFSAPWLGAEALRTANRASLWAFRVDWYADHVATSADQLSELTSACLAVADGAEPPDRLTGLLAGIRDDLARGSDFEVRRPVWREELRRMLDAMAVEAAWRRDASTVTVEQYLDNADNLGSAFVNVSHWLANTEPAVHNVLPQVLAAARAQQRVIRVLNDLATYERDLAWGDLNVLRLGPDRAAAQDLLASLTRECEDSLVPLRTGQPRLATFLHRQVEFCRGFYGLTDYWGQW